MDGKKSQAIEIFLNGCGVKQEHILQSVVDLDEKAIQVENLKRINDEFLPAGEELQTLKEFEKDNDPKELPWGRAEEFCIFLVKIADFNVRALCCVARGEFAENFESIAQDIGIFRKCISNLCKSRAIPSILALVIQIGNFLNHGTNKGGQGCFRLEDLSLLNRCEGASDKTYTLMRFVMETLELDKSVREEALEDMKLCETASKLDFGDACARLADLEKAVTKVEEITSDSSKGVSDDKFNEAMRTFVGNSKGKLTELRTQVEEVTQSIKECCDRYAEKPRTPEKETLQKFAEFRKDMEEARRTNLLARAKKEKAEKRRMEAEAAAKAKAEKAGQAEAGGKSDGKKPDQKKAAAKKDGCANEVPSSPAKSSKVKMKVKIPVTPLLSSSKNLRDSMPSGSSRGPKETSSGLHFGKEFHPPERERMTLGPGSRPDMFKVSSSSSGRISIGVAHASAAKVLKSREELRRLLTEEAPR